MSGQRPRALKSALGAGACALGLHELSWSAPDAGACVESGTCERCGQVEERAAHAWGAWAYEERARGPIRACRRCGLHVSPFPAQRVEPPDGDEAPPPGEPPDADEAPSTGESDVAMLAEMLERQAADGTMTPERALANRSLLREVQQAMANPDRQAGTARMQELMQRMGPSLADPSRPEPVPAPAAGSRAALLADHVRALIAYVFAGEVAGTNLAGDSGEEVGGLLASLREARDALATWPPGADVTPLEAEVLRPAMLDARRFSLRHHLTFAQPVWPSGKVAQDASAVFYSGGPHVGVMLDAAAVERRLKLLVREPHREPTSLRWEQLRSCAVAVFDLTEYEAGMPLEAAAGVASITYELGSALALGRPVLIVAEEGQALPFDVDIEPLRLADAATVEAALDEALYALQRTTAGSSVDRSIEHLCEELADGSAGRAEAFSVLTPGVATDPINARRRAELALSFQPGGRTLALLPCWPGSYPDPARPRCFHVTPFGPAWAADTMRTVADACTPGVTYFRGDAVLTHDMIRSIWDEICTATHLVVDLTGLNPNVALELGIAHALGRNVLLVSQDERPERFFGAVAKYRCHHYSDQDELRTVVDRFLSS